jgi:hypothetical protein
MTFFPPITMMEFFRKSEGTWFIQRNVHHFDNVNDESGESNLIVNVVQPDDPRVNKICEQQGIDTRLARGGASFIWQSIFDDAPPNEDYAAVLIDVPDNETGLTGKLIRDRGYIEKMPVISHYWFGKDGVLTIDTEYDNNQGQERCWFMSDDFRVRVSSSRMVNGVNLVAYCSERRCVSQSTLEAMVQNNLARAAIA